MWVLGNSASSSVPLPSQIHKTTPITSHPLVSLARTAVAAPRYSSRCREGFSRRSWDWQNLLNGSSTHQNPFRDSSPYLNESFNPTFNTFLLHLIIITGSSIFIRTSQRKSISATRMREMANNQVGHQTNLDRYIVIHVATTCDEHGVYVTKDSAEVIELGWILLNAKTLEEVMRPSPQGAVAAQRHLSPVCMF